MPSNIEFIIFAVKQACKAEKFGFTRNESCRNLKTALHQYWQNKTLGLHGQSQKNNIPRSLAAIDLDLKDCDVEHSVPQMVIVNMLMDMESISLSKVEALLIKYFRVLLVTKEEHSLLNSSGLRSSMSKDWDGDDPMARYHAVGIIPIDRYNIHSLSMGTVCEEEHKLKNTRNNIDSVKLKDMLDYKIRFALKSSRKPSSKLFDGKPNCSGYNINKLIYDGMTVNQYQAIIKKKFNSNDPQFSLTKHLKYDIEQGFIELVM